MKHIIVSVIFVLLAMSVYAVDENTGKVLKTGKFGAYCTVKVEGATFPNSCTTAMYQEAFFLM